MFDQGGDYEKMQVFKFTQMLEIEALQQAFYLNQGDEIFMDFEFE